MAGTGVKALLWQAADAKAARDYVRAQQLYIDALRADPRNVAGHCGLSGVYLAIGRPDLAIKLAESAAQMDPGNADVVYVLGVAFCQTGRAAEAERILTPFAGKPSVGAKILIAYAEALRILAKLAEAESAARQAVGVDPREVDAWATLGAILQAGGRFEESAACYEEALKINPDHFQSVSNGGAVLSQLGRFEQAESFLRSGITRYPHAHVMHQSLGNVLRHLGKFDEAIASYRRAMEIEPRNVKAHDTMLLAFLYHPAASSKMILDESRRWETAHARPLKQRIRPFTNPRDPNRRLRIGYVSGDFRGHSCAFFSMPLLMHHDAAAVDVFCYSNQPGGDSVTDRFRSVVPQWRDIAGLTDDQAAERIRGDGIDILVDLHLHTAFNRLMVFAQKPAPVQVTWLGYPGTTGLDTIDYRISDPYLDPPTRDEGMYSETTLRLDHCFWCYDPTATGLSGDPDATKTTTGEAIVFGCLNTFTKINPVVLGLWADVLKAAPGSRMIILCDAVAPRQRTANALQQLGIEPTRIEFIGLQAREQYLETYRRIDIALDTFPYTGHTTTCDAIWMATPVVTLAGEMAVSRGGASIISAAGFPEWVAQTREQYVGIATELAGDRQRLADLHRTLRSRLKASPVMDAPRFARNMESLYRQMWRAWCKQM